MNLFPPLTAETRKTLERLLPVIDKAFPLPQRFRHKLKNDVAELSALFTSSRPERGASYLGRPNLLSAYLRYFLPWNIYRLCRLLPSLPLTLKDGDAVTDLGSGPLSLVLALWICCPELRKLNLEFRCVDRTPAVLEAGRKLFEALLSDENENSWASPNIRWNIKTIRGEIHNNGRLSVQIHGQPAALVSVLNVYNEIFWNFSPLDKVSLRNLAMQSGRFMLNSLCAERGHILVVEPGIPRSGEFISMLRAAFLEQGFNAVSPCLHNGVCSYPGVNLLTGEQKFRGKAKWCHFPFDTDGAPVQLLKLSSDAGIPKERGVMSFILAGKGQLQSGKGTFSNHKKNVTTTALIISDAFPAGEQYGRYGCSALGAVLALGKREEAEAFCPGSIAELKMSGARDFKSGALTGSIMV
ncbi:MAG: rRNA methyltransferase [Treponema sp.]|jgi:ribosomal protein RSM22 (predicted rRNA methylase)|nr:rRNA methyltransferase [Treponema sp.]